MNETETHCPHCGASMKAFWHRITPGLVGTLVKVYVKVCSKNENIIHKNELELTHSEYGNFQKLRFHGLIAKHRIEGAWREGEWLITKRGGQFLRGEIQIPARVKTFRNRVIGHDTDVVAIKDVIGTEPFFEQKFAFEFIELPEDDFTDGIAIPKRSKRKKNEKRCTKCETVMIKKTKCEPGSTPETVYVERWWECPKCFYKVTENYEHPAVY